MESENSRGINFHSGSLLEATTYNIDLQAGGIFGFDMFMGDAGTADINLRGQLVHFALYGGHSESPVFLTTQAAAQSGSIFLGPHVTSGFSQDGNSPAATVVEYDTVKPWSMQSCKWQGNVNLGSNVKQVISICSEFTAGDFTGATDKVMKLGHKAESYPNFECGPFKIEQAAGYPAGIMLRDIDDTQSARIYRSDGMPDTYYGKLGDFALAVNYGLSECLGWACTVSGDFEQETVKATYVPVGIVGTVTTWAKTLLDDPDAATARTTLGLGTMATQDADDVAITGGSIAGLTSPLAVADGGTGGSTKAAAKTSLVLSGSRSWHETRTLPTTVNNYVEVGSLTKSACGYNVDIAVTVSDSGFSVAKRYLITARYTGTTSGTWYTARPLSSTGAYSGQDFALDVMWDQSTSKLTFRLRRSSGSTAGDAHVVLHDKGHSSTTFAALTGTGSMAAPSAWWPSTVMSQCDGVVDIDELTLVTPLDIPYGGTNADNAADARANLGVLTQIANNPTAKTGDYSVTAADTGKLFSNAGATGTVTLTLPSATVGLVYAFARTAAQIIYAHAGSGNDFRGRPGKKLELMSEESVVIVRCFETGVWNVWTLFGSYQWVDE